MNFNEFCFYVYLLLACEASLFCFSYFICSLQCKLNSLSLLLVKEMQFSHYVDYISKAYMYFSKVFSKDNSKHISITT